MKLKGFSTEETIILHAIKWFLANNYYACLTGDCPHDLEEDCVLELLKRIKQCILRVESEENHE